MPSLRAEHYYITARLHPLTRKLDPILDQRFVEDSQDTRDNGKVSGRVDFPIVIRYVRITIAHLHLESSHRAHQPSQAYQSIAL